jgi:hypothetical protein
LASSFAGTISPPGLGPLIPGPTVIDGRTAPGYVGGPRIELDGTLAFPRGLWITGGDSEVRGLAINRWNGIAIYLDGWGNNVIKGNGVGIDPTGSIRRANAQQGIMAAESHDNVIGGPGPNELNVVTGNSIGIHITGVGGRHNVVQGNIVGLGVDGSTALPGPPSNAGNAIGIAVSGPNNLIGGAGAGEGNLTSGNAQQGISIAGATAVGNIVQGNIVGLTADQSAKRPNDFGIEVNGAVQTQVGGTAPGERNVTAGNGRYGVIVSANATTTQTTIQGNRIGTNDAGSSGLGNGLYGIYVGQFGNVATQTLVGGMTAGTGNVIAYNVKDGVFLETKTGTRVLGNSIHSNGELGIDNQPNGVNTLSAAYREPTLASAVTVNGTTTVQGSLAAASTNAAYRIELFRNSVCDASGRGEGEVFLGFVNVTTNGSGNASFSWTAPSAIPAGAVITATSTNPAGDVSEFSNCVAKGAAPVDTATGSGAVGTTTTTDSEGDGATASDPVETSVTVPPSVATPAPISITESTSLGTPPANYTFFGMEVTITAPVATPALPLTITFDIDALAIPAGETAATVAVLRNGTPIADCTTAGPDATPDACVASRQTVAGGDIRLAVRTSHASTWDFATFAGIPPAPTPVGSNVPVEPTDETTGTSPVTLTFDHVTAAGSTSLATSATGPAHPAGFRFGDPATFYDLTTTATFTGAIAVCIEYSSSAFADEGGLRLFHHEGGAWVDITTSLDTAGDRICGSATSLSPFAIAERMYPFGGFTSPVDPQPTVNRVRAGSGIPVKFSLGGNLGLAIFKPGYPASQSVSCDSHLPVDEIETTVTAGQSSLQYDPTTGGYTYVWKTDKAWLNTCRKLVLTFRDGTKAEATFQFTK